MLIQLTVNNLYLADQFEYANIQPIIKHQIQIITTFNFRPRLNSIHIFYQTMSKERQLLSLAQLRKQYDKESAVSKENVDRHYSTIGLVIDCSNVYRYETNRDFTQKFKIIDASNQTDPLQIYIWSNRKQDFLVNVKIGDILFINNFKVELYKDTLQAKKAFKVEDSYFRLFSGNTELSNYSPIDKKVGLDDEDGKILTALGELRKFSKNHFKNTRVPVLFRNDNLPKEGKGKAAVKSVTSSDFDIILRVVESVDAVTHFKIRLTANDKEQYHLNYTRHIEPGVYKIRSVAAAKWEEKHCSLAGNDYTYFLEISSWMKSYDSKEWDKLVPGSEAGKKKLVRPYISSEVLVDSLEQEKKKKLQTLTLKQLISKDDHKTNVIINLCEVVDIPTPFQHALKRYDSENNTEKSSLSETGEYIYSIHLLLTDQSLNGEVMNAYVYTFDGQGLQFLPDLDPQSIYGRYTVDTKELYDNFVNRLTEESDFKEVPLSVMLEPLFNGRETIYRIVKTALLF